MSRTPKRRPSIHDVAAEAGVSITTVSHALNGRGRVQPETRDRVQAIAEELGYTANVHAQRLATGNNQAIALQVSGYGTSIASVDSAYYIDILNAASSTAIELGYMPLLTPPEIREREVDLAIDGALIIDPTGEESLMHSVADSGGVVVTAGRPLDGRGNVKGWVDNDLRGFARTVLEHLEAQGYTRPAILTGPENRSYSADTVAAYREWVEEKNLEEIIAVVHGNPTAQLALEEARALLGTDNRPDAIYTSFDVFALGALRAADELGIKVPDELGIVATVDSEAMRSSYIPLTAIDLHSREIGIEAIRLLIDLIAGNRRGPVGLTIPAELQVRSSTLRRG